MPSHKFVNSLSPLRLPVSSRWLDGVMSKAIQIVVLARFLLDHCRAMVQLAERLVAQIEVLIDRVLLIQGALGLELFAVV